MSTLKIAAAIAVTLLTVPTQVEARRGACDGFNKCRCGVTAARQAGLPLDYQGLNLKMARTWYAFPRTTCQAGAVGIPHAHHVYTVMQCNGDGTALVKDDAGTYTRQVAGNVFVDPHSNAVRAYASDNYTSYSARGKRHRKMASAPVSTQPYSFNAY